MGLFRRRSKNSGEGQQIIHRHAKGSRKGGQFKAKPSPEKAAPSPGVSLAGSTSTLIEDTPIGDGDRVVDDVYRDFAERRAVAEEEEAAAERHLGYEDATRLGVRGALPSVDDRPDGEQVFAARRAIFDALPEDHPQKANLRRLYRRYDNPPDGHGRDRQREAIDRHWSKNPRCDALWQASQRERRSYERSLRSIGAEEAAGWVSERGLSPVMAAGAGPGAGAGERFAAQRELFESMPEDHPERRNLHRLYRDYDLYRRYDNTPHAVNGQTEPDRRRKVDEYWAANPRCAGMWQGAKNAAAAAV